MAETGLNERDEVEALLPFLANDTLDGDERVRVEAAVAADADLAVQLRALRRIRSEVKAEAMDWSPGEMGLAKLMREIEAEAPGELSEADQTSEDARPSRLTLHDAITGPAASTVTQTRAAPAPANTNVRVRIWQIAAAVAMAAFVAQSLFVWTGNGSGPDVELASGDPAAPIGEGRLRIAFQPTASESDMRALLLEQNLVIVDGPSALGLYTVAVDEAAVDDALAALLSKRNVIETVSVGQ